MVVDTFLFDLSWLAKLDVSSERKRICPVSLAFDSDLLGAKNVVLGLFEVLLALRLLYLKFNEILEWLKLMETPQRRFYVVNGL